MEGQLVQERQNRFDAKSRKIPLTDTFYIERRRDRRRFGCEKRAMKNAIGWPFRGEILIVRDGLCLGVMTRKREKKFAWNTFPG